MQNLFLKLIQKSILPPEGNEKSYLLKATANMCKNQLKSANRKRKVCLDNINEVEKHTNTMDNGDIVDYMQILPKKYRIVIHLHYYEGYTFEEIGRMLHISKSAVSMRIHRGRDTLKQMLLNDFVE